MKLNKAVIKKYSDNILLMYQSNNHKFDFFSDYEEVYFDIKGIKFASTCENINNLFQEVDYFLLENKKVARFTRHYNHNSSNRKLLDTFSIRAYKDNFKKRSSLKEFLKLEKKLISI